MLIYFRYGQLSGLVEPIAGVLGALLVGIMNPILPYALAFAAKSLGCQAIIFMPKVNTYFQIDYSKPFVHAYNFANVAQSRTW